MDRWKPSGGGVWALFACQLVLLILGGLGASVEEFPGALYEHMYLQFSNGPPAALLLLTPCLGLALLSLACWHKKVMDFLPPFFSIVMVYRCCWSLVDQALSALEWLYYNQIT